MKFSQPGQNHVSPVSDVDLGIYQLQRSERLLEERVEALGLEAEKCVPDTIKRCLMQCDPSFNVVKYVMLQYCV